MQTLILLIVAMWALYTAYSTQNYQGNQTPYYYMLEITWLPKDMCGWGNGYVVILDQSHPLFGEHYMGHQNEDGSYDWDSKLDHLYVHGGITFSEYDEQRRGWVIGFDSAHWQDNQDNRSKEWCIEHTKELLKQVNNFKD